LLHVYRGSRFWVQRFWVQGFKGSKVPGSRFWVQRFWVQRFWVQGLRFRVKDLANQLAQKTAGLIRREAESDSGLLLTF